VKFTINDREITLNPRGWVLKLIRALLFKQAMERDSAGKWVKKSKLDLFRIWLAVGFSLFIIEEGIQTIMFSTFPLQDVNDYVRIASRASYIRTASTGGKVVNYMIGWTNPLMMYAYDQYWKAADMYADSLEVLCAVNGMITPGAEVTTSARGTPAVDIMNNDLVDTSGSTAVVDFGGLSSLVVGPPDWSNAPFLDDESVIVINSAASLEQITPFTDFVGWMKTVVIPVTVVQPGSSVINAKSPFLFAITAFPRNEICYNILKYVQNYWVAVNGEIGEFNGSPQIILNSANQILGVKSMAPDGVWIPFDEFYRSITTTEAVP